MNFAMCAAGVVSLVLMIVYAINGAYLEGVVTLQPHVARVHEPRFGAGQSTVATTNHHIGSVEQPRRQLDEAHVLDDRRSAGLDVQRGPLVRLQLDAIDQDSGEGVARGRDPALPSVVVCRLAHARRLS